MGSNLVTYETQGALKKLTGINALDLQNGIIAYTNKDSTMKNRFDMFDNFRNGSYSEKYGMDILNLILYKTDLKILSLTRNDGALDIDFQIKGTLIKDTFSVNYKHKGY